MLFINSRVRVKNKGKRYTGYTEFFRENDCLHFLPAYQRNQFEHLGSPMNGDYGVVKFCGMHRNCVNQLAVIQLDRLPGLYFLFGVEGLDDLGTIEESLDWDPVIEMSDFEAAIFC